MSSLSTLIGVYKNDIDFAAINRMDTQVFNGLTELIYLLGASAVNEEAFSILDAAVSPGGILEGQSKADPDEEMVMPEPTETEYLRPNGEPYFARDWTGIQDVQVLRMAREQMVFPLLDGQPGTGKTALAEAAIPDLLTVVCTADTNVADLLGKWEPNPKLGVDGDDREYVWSNGPITTAVLEGRTVLIDEIGLLDAKVGSVLYPLMDGRLTLTVEANSEIGTIKAAPGFFIIGAYNPDAPGVNMSEALLSRFGLHVEVTTDWAIAVQKLGVPEAISGIAQSLNRKIGSEVDWAPQMRELIIFTKNKQIFGEKFAVANLIATAPAADREFVQEAIARHYGPTALAARI